MKRTFYRTVIEVTVLSEYEPAENYGSVTMLGNAIEQGDWSGESRIARVNRLTPQETAQALIAQGSDPEFFGLTEDGEDLYAEEEEGESED